jgi:hypothetical protein
MKIKQILIVFITLIISGCSNLQTMNPTAVSSDTPSRQIENTVTLPAATNTFIPSKTILPSTTPTKTSFPTWTLLPTLSDGQAGARMMAWFKGSPECLLPCWGGITSGVTTWQEAKQILAPIVRIAVSEEQMICTFGPCNNMEWRSRENTSFGTTIRGFLASGSDNFIFGMRIDVSKPVSTYRLDTVLSQYGPPDQVYLTQSNIFAPPGDLFLEITLAYPNHQVIFHYQWNVSLIGDKLVSCIQDGLGVTLYINPKIIAIWDENTIKHVLYGQYQEYEIDGISFEPFQEVTGMTIQNFYEEFKSIDGSECITTLSNYWLP